MTPRALYIAGRRQRGRQWVAQLRDIRTNEIVATANGATPAEAMREAERIKLRLSDHAAAGDTTGGCSSPEHSATPGCELGGNSP